MPKSNKTQSKTRRAQTAAEQSKGRKGGRNPSVRHSRLEKDARARGNKGARSARGSGPACEKCGQIHKRCSAHNNRGGPCGQQPLRFQDVCRSHGGNTKLSRLAAQERMMELVWPALARLEELVNDPNTDPAIVVKVVSQILDRAHGAGLSRQAHVALGFAEETVWDKLGEAAFVAVDRSALGPAHDPAAIPSGGGGHDGDDVLDDVLDARERTRAREASTRISNDGHEVIRGEVSRQREAMDPFDTELREREEYDRTRSEFEGERLSDDDRTYEDRLRARVEESERRTGRKR